MSQHINNQGATDIGKFNNSWYKPGRGVIVRSLWFLVNVMVLKNPANPFSGLKKFWLRVFGAKIGQGVVIKPGVSVKFPWRLSIGDFSWIGEGVWIDNLGDVKIGNHVCISQGAMLLTGNHNFKKASFDLIVGDIHLEDGVWIGAMSVVGPGVTCYSHSVLSVQSFASKDLEAYTIYGGNPCEIIRKREIAE